MIQHSSLPHRELAGAWPRDGQTGPDAGSGARRFLQAIWRAIDSTVFDRFRARMRRKVTSGLVLAEATGRGRVLEVGVGAGLGLDGYAQSYEVVGTEIDAERLGRARQRVASKAMDNISGLHRMAPDKLAFSDASFDAVTAFHIITRHQHATRAIGELVRVTRPGGRIIVVNRFASEGFRTFKRVLRSWLGQGSRLRPRLPMAMLTRRRDLALIRQMALGPFGVFTVCEFEKRA